MYKIAEHVLYEDDKLLVCVKPAGIAVQTKRMGEQDMECFGIILLQKERLPLLESSIA